VQHLVCLSPDADRKDFRKIAELFPCRVLCAPGGPNICQGSHVVTTDQQQAARLVIEHLLKQGHRKVRIVAGGLPGEESWVSEAANAARNLLEIAGSEFVPHYMFREEGDWLQSCVRDEGVTAFWALHDHHAFQIVRALHALGLRVPEDVSVVGRFDTPWAVESRPTLTTVSIDPEASAKAVLRALEVLDAEESPQTSSRTQVPPRLIVRGSTGPARKKA
jgi:LacI family transcriptional regulator